MTDLAEAPGAPPTDVAAVADNFVALMRSFVKARNRLLAENDVEWSAHVLLRTLQNDGPMRASALADAVQSDPSTVSRQVATLVKDGLLDRRSDPEDGRAALLVLTDRARAVLADHEQVRREYFARMLVDWETHELRDFAAMLARFTDDYDHANTTWMSERLSRGALRSGGTN